MIKLNLTENESQVFMQMLDAAVKSQGLAAAEAGLVLARKVNAAIAESKLSQEKSETEPKASQDKSD